MKLILILALALLAVRQWSLYSLVATPLLAEVPGVTTLKVQGGSQGSKDLMPWNAYFGQPRVGPQYRDDGINAPLGVLPLRRWLQLVYGSRERIE